MNVFFYKYKSVLKGLLLLILHVFVHTTQYITELKANLKHGGFWARVKYDCILFLIEVFFVFYLVHNSPWTTTLNKFKNKNTWVKRKVYRCIVPVFKMHQFKSLPFVQLHPTCVAVDCDS